MPRCSVLLCRNDSRSVNVSNGGVSYHRYPKDPATKEKWIDSTGRANWFPKPSSVICSEHFEPEDFLLSKKGYKHIRDNAVPTRKFLSFHDRTPAVLKLNSETTDDLDDDDALPLASAPVGGTPGARRKRAAGCSTPTSSLKSQKKAGSDSAKPKSDESDSLDEVDYENLSLKEKELEGMFRYEKNVIEKQAIKMKNLKRKLRRLKTTLTDMEDLYKVLEEKCHISNEDLMYLRSTQVKVSELVVRRQTNVELSEVVSKLTYSVEFRRFALTLHFTSAAAYDYVRKMFKTSLPYPMTLKHWYLTVNGEPGFTKEAFVAMKRKADASNRPIVATLAVDDMSLNRRVEVDGKLYGYVDVGTGLDTDMLEEAREVLALSITAVNGHFSVPIAYFLTSTVTSEQRAKLVKFAIEMARDAGINIVALSFEENHSNMNMVRQLKCETKFRDGHITYNHPDMAPIIVILDPSKLVERLERAFRNYETLIDKDGNKIQWMFIKELIEVRYLNGINGQIVDFQNTRVKVKLATELFSPKIAEALQYCRIDLGLKAFKDSEPTQTFITICSTFYEVFNSINSHVYGYKNILNKNNAAQIFEFLNMATDYITNLNVKNIGPVIRNPKESLSFVAGIKQLYMMMFQTNILDGLPLYKLSLDHLKHIFWNIKEDAKCNIETNPTPKKAIFAYKKIVAQMKVTKYINPPLEQISIPLSPSPVNRINRIAGYDLKKEDKIEDDPDLEEAIGILSSNKEIAVVQIAAYIVRQLIKKINCDVCVEALVTNERSNNNFIVAKDKTNFLFPSLEVIKVCRTTQIFLKGFDGQKSRQVVRGQAMMATVMRQFVDSKIFDRISYHEVGEFPQSNHVTDLMKAVVERYARVHYKARIKGEMYRDVRAQFEKHGCGRRRRRPCGLADWRTPTNN